MLAEGFKLHIIDYVKLKEIHDSPQDMPSASCSIGWHGSTDKIPPRLGIGSATVDPIREPRDITKVKAVLAASPRDYSLFMVGIHAGLRGSDLLALKWDHVRDESGKVGSWLLVTESKTKKTRQIPLQPKVREALENWRTRRFCTPDSLIWPGTNGRMTIQRLHQLVNQWCAAAGIEGHFGTHTLRKTYGYQLRRIGIDLSLIMQIFGHSSAAITLRYMGWTRAEINEASLKLRL